MASTAIEQPGCSRKLKNSLFLLLRPACIILQKGVLNGNFSWRVQMPILVTYQSASEFTQQNNVVTMLITRVSTLTHL